MAATIVNLLGSASVRVLDFRPTAETRSQTLLLAGKIVAAETAWRSRLTMLQRALQLVAPEVR